MNTNLAATSKVPVQVWNGQRVVTYNDIARLHQVPPARIFKAFLRHSDELFEGEDYFDLDRDEAVTYMRQLADDEKVRTRASKLRVFTESGYLILACTFRDKKAALVRRTLVNSYFKAKDTRKEEAALPNQIASKLVEAVANQNQMLLAISGVLDKVIDSQVAAITAPQVPSISIPGSVPAEKNDVGMLSNPEKMQDGEATTTFLAKRCNWYSTQNKPHVLFTEHVLRTLGIRTNKTHEFNEPYSRCVVKNVNGVIVRQLYIKPAGIQKLLDWCEKTDYARSLKHVERYQQNFSIHKAGDVKSVYYLLETDGVKGICRADKKRYNLKEF